MDSYICPHLIQFLQNKYEMLGPKGKLRVGYHNRPFPSYCLPLVKNDWPIHNY